VAQEGPGNKNLGHICSSQISQEISLKKKILIKEKKKKNKWVFTFQIGKACGKERAW
jgi:hypothetical protein